MLKRKRIDDTISFDNLPYEVLIRIFNNFELSDLGKMAITSKANREVVKDIQKSILGIFRPFLWFSEWRSLFCLDTHTHACTRTQSHTHLEVHARVRACARTHSIQSHTYTHTLNFA